MNNNTSSKKVPIPEPDHGVVYTEEQLLAYGKASAEKAQQELIEWLSAGAGEPVAYRTEDDTNGVSVWLFRKTAVKYQDPPDALYTQEQVAAAVAVEREECAKSCDVQAISRKALEHYAALTYSGAANECAAAIRGRTK